MKFVVGLGNPGKEYTRTRHNIGFVVVDELAQEVAAKSESGVAVFQEKPKFKAEIYQTADILFIKPQTYMNESGGAVQAVVNFYRKELLSAKHSLTDLFVIHDDLDLATGSYKIQLGKGPKVHNGLLSIYNSLHTQDFWHVRLGIDSRQGDRTIPSQDYVLSPFLLVEKQLVEEMKRKVITELLQKLELPW